LPLVRVHRQIWFSSRTATYLKELPVKKIALTMIAVSALGLAACSKSDPANEALSNAANSMNNAVEDVRGAANDMREGAENAAAAGQEQVNQAVQSTTNVTEATTTAVANETKQ
jgi:signal transduction histidine kinase